MQPLPNLLTDLSRGPLSRTTVLLPSRRLLLPAVATEQLHEATLPEVLLDEPARAAPDADQRLELLLADRQDEPPRGLH